MDGLTIGTSVFLAIVFVASILGNVLVLVVRFAKFNSGDFNSYRFLICHLAAVDILYATYIPIAIQTNLASKWQLGTFPCKFLRTFNSIVFNVSLFNVVAVAYERYRSLSNPIRHRWTIGFSAKVISAVWLFSVAIFIPYFLALAVRYDLCYDEYVSRSFARGYALTQLIIAYVFPITFLIVCNFKIMVMLRNRAVRVRAASSSVITTGIDEQMHARTNGEFTQQRMTSGYEANIAVSQRNVASFTKQYRTVVKVLLAMTVTFMVISLPGHIYYLCYEFQVELSYLAQSTLIALTYIYYLNCCANPVIYSVLDKRFRRDVKRLFNTCWSRFAS